MKRAWTACPYCDKKFRTFHPYPAWVCEKCEPDAAADAVSAITSELTRAVVKRLATCRYDGCLLIGRGTCPACHLRVAGPRPIRSTTTPAGWVRKGLVYRRMLRYGDEVS